MGGTASGYGQYCPIVRAVELLGERWTLLIIRDMLVGVSRFNDLSRGLPGLSRTLLTKRLRQLESAGIVERLDGQYLLTEAGKDLESIVFGFGEWGARWAFEDPHPEELDAELLVWWMHSRIHTDPLPDRRVVLHIRFSDDRRLFWIIVEPESSSVCLTDPMFDVDVTIRSDTATLYKVWLGREPIRTALRDGTLEFEGPQALVRRMPDVLQLSPVADMVAATQAAGVHLPD
ncbi:MAG: helix-turn-helix domain-containing protein [Actinomycetota bacterium]